MTLFPGVFWEKKSVTSSSQKVSLVGPIQGVETVPDILVGVLGLLVVVQGSLGIAIVHGCPWSFVYGLATPGLPVRMLVALGPIDSLPGFHGDRFHEQQPAGLRQCRFQIVGASFP